MFYYIALSHNAFVMRFATKTKAIAVLEVAVLLATQVVLVKAELPLLGPR